MARRASLTCGGAAALAVAVMASGLRSGRPGLAEPAARLHLPGPRRPAARPADRRVGQRRRRRNGERLDGRPAGERPRRWLGPLVGRASGDGRRRAVHARSARRVGRRPDPLRHPRRRRVAVLRPVQHGADRLALEERRVGGGAVGRRSASPAHRAARRPDGAGRGPAGGCSLAPRRSGDRPQLLGRLLLRRARAAGQPEGAHGPRSSRRGAAPPPRPGLPRAVCARPAGSTIASTCCASSVRTRRPPTSAWAACGRTGGARAPGPAPSRGSPSPPAPASGPTCPSP